MVLMPLSLRRERLICTVELGGGFFVQKRAEFAQESAALEVFFSVAEICLLYTSDAADDA